MWNNSIIKTKHLVDEFETGKIQKPPFQRDKQWSLSKKQGLILTILEEKFINNITISTLINTDRPQYIVDGFQRMTTLVDFRQNKFPVNLNNNILYFKDLNSHMQSVFDNYQVLVTNVKCNDLSEMQDVFVKANIGETLNFMQTYKGFRDFAKLMSSCFASDDVVNLFGKTNPKLHNYVKLASALYIYENEVTNSDSKSIGSQINRADTKCGSLDDFCKSLTVNHKDVINAAKKTNLLLNKQLSYDKTVNTKIGIFLLHLMGYDVNSKNASKFSFYKLKNKYIATHGKYSRKACEDSYLKLLFS